jgi:hypothetical protein
MENTACLSRQIARCYFTGVSDHSQSFELNRRVNETQSDQQPHWSRVIARLTNPTAGSRLTPVKLSDRADEAHSARRFLDGLT